MEKSLYFDAAATTFMSESTKSSLLYWCNKGNPSSTHAYADEFHSMKLKFEMLVASQLGIDINNYYIIWTSGASESNSTIISMIVSSYTKLKGIPHVIVSEVEHKSIMNQVNTLKSAGAIELSILGVNIDGSAKISELKSLIKSNTALVCIQSANNETGCLNDINSVYDILSNVVIDKTLINIPLHVDSVQTFGKKQAGTADSFSISFHKLGGPPGVGCLVVSKALYDKWGFSPVIFGNQNDGMRGGTENVVGIGASYTASVENFTDRVAKNAHLCDMRNYLIKSLSKFKDFPIMTYKKYLSSPTTSLVVISPSASVPNIVLASFVDINKRICNSKILKYLYDHNVYVSVGSACNSLTTSHVMDAINADKYIRAGTLRISFDDSVTTEKIDQLIDAIVDAINHTLLK